MYISAIAMLSKWTSLQWIIFAVILQEGICTIDCCTLAMHAPGDSFSLITMYSPVKQLPNPCSNYVFVHTIELLNWCFQCMSVCRVPSHAWFTYIKGRWCKINCSRMFIPLWYSMFFTLYCDDFKRSVGSPALFFLPLKPSPMSAKMKNNANFDTHLHTAAYIYNWYLCSIQVIHDAESNIFISINELADE